MKDQIISFSYDTLNRGGGGGGRTDMEALKRLKHKLPIQGFYGVN